ncbi:putative mitochondrial acidic protein mam33 isoform X1 [Iris pallida]|uniref:Mitochondrial acidic protein mam33 isoform X1 n=1 Tax=Iris pallida TaxID=29817 RepID=A0AAX6GG30_IRIPA|nr:putative mitochondrial acidic protein mam33 isoform X1 [Iris pallida]
MWKRLFQMNGGVTTAAALGCLSPSSGRSLSSAASSAVDSLVLRSLKEHYLEVSKMTPPPKVNPPSPYSVVKGSLESGGPVLRGEYKGEEVSISVMRLANIMPAGAEEEEDEDSINQLFLHVDISRPGREESLHFLCGLYPDALGIHSVCLRPKDLGSGDLDAVTKYRGRVFQELDQKLRDAFHMYIEARGVNEKLFPFLQAWLYVKDHRNVMQWFKSVGTFITEHKQT